MTQAKAVSNYTNSILANMEATDEGYDEALLLDSPASCPKARARTFCGQERRDLHARPVGWRSERHHPQHHLPHRRGTWAWRLCKSASRATRCTSPTKPFTGTAAEVTPSAAGSHRAGQGDYVGSRGPITEKIQTAFFDIVNGRNPQYAHWLQGLIMSQAVVEVLAKDLNAKGACSAPIPRPT